MYYIGTEDECNNYLNEVNSIENYEGNTIEWSKVIIHPNGIDCAIKKHLRHNSKLSETAELTSDWFSDDV